MTFSNNLIIATLLLFSTYSDSFAQEQSHDDLFIQSKVDLLFDAMRANDSTMVEGLFVDGALLSSIYTDKKTQKVVKRSSPVSKFVTAIGTPHDELWDEKIWSYKIQQDGPMAYVWTDYTFYVNKDLSHCGVNVFELMKTELGWQISGITDTRRTAGCQSDTINNIHNLIDAWHKSAAVADEDVFFRSMTEDGIYIGTDAAERWTRDEMFELLGKYFERDSAWDFTATERNITIADGGEMAYFDELLDTWMGTCRSSGVVQLIDGSWKIAHYHLSIAVPNDQVDGYLKLIGKERK